MCAAYLSFSSLCRISSIKGVYANPYGELTSFLPESDNLYRQDSPQGCGNTCCTCHARAVCACSRYYDARHVPNLQHICSGLLLEDIWSLGLHRHGMPASSWGFVLRILLLALCHVVRSAAQPSEPLPLAVPSGQAPLGHAGTVWDSSTGIAGSRADALPLDAAARGASFLPHAASSLLKDPCALALAALRAGRQTLLVRLCTNLLCAGHRSLQHYHSSDQGIVQWLSIVIHLNALD